MYQYQAIDKLPSPPTQWTLKGTLVHTALETLFSQPKGQRTEAFALGALDDAFDADEGREGLAAIGVERAAAVAYRDDARALVRGYFALEDPDSIEVVGTELKLDATLDSPDGADAVHLRGIIDRLDREPDGSLVVVDYKTGRAPAPGRERAKLAAVETYALLVERVMGERPAAVRLLHLREPVVIERRVGETEVSRQERRTIEVWHAIERAHAAGSFRPSPGPLCRYCAYSDRCEGGQGFLGLAAG